MIHSIDTIARSKEIILIYIRKFPAIVKKFSHTFLTIAIYLGDEAVYDAVSKLIEDICTLSSVEICLPKIVNYKLIYSLALSGIFAKSLNANYFDRNLACRHNFIHIDTIKLYKNRIETLSIIRYAASIGDLEAINYLCPDNSIKS